MQGFFPWGFPENKVEIYTIYYPISRYKISVFLEKKDDDRVVAVFYLFKKGIVQKRIEFLFNVGRKKINFEIIRTGYTFQVTLNSRTNHEIFQFGCEDFNNFALVFPPKISSNKKSFLKISYEQ